MRLSPPPRRGLLRTALSGFGTASDPSFGCGGAPSLRRRLPAQIRTACLLRLTGFVPDRDGDPGREAAQAVGNLEQLGPRKQRRKGFPQSIQSYVDGVAMAQRMVLRSTPDGGVQRFESETRPPGAGDRGKQLEPLQGQLDAAGAADRFAGVERDDEIGLVFRQLTRREEPSSIVALVHDAE